MTLNEILRRHPSSAPILHCYGLDACCGGGKSLATAASAHSLNLQDLAAELRAAMPPADPGAAQPAPASFAV
jgi:iron-sulfur cluster repair protein YtfE (RIC family)